MMSFAFGGFGMIFMLIFWIVIIGLAVWLVSTLFPRPTNTSLYRSGIQPGGSAELALEILKQRYARGEISKAEYETMRRDLQE